MVATTTPPTSAERRQQSRRHWVRLGGVLTVGCLLASFFSVLNWMARGLEHRSWTVPPPSSGQLRVEANAGDVMLRPSESDQITVTAELEWSLVRPQMNEGYDGRTLRLESRCQAALGHCNVTVTVWLPAKLAVAADTPGGDVDATDLTGALDLSSVGGNIHVANSTGTVRANSASGEVDIASISSPEINAVSLSGNVLVTCSKPPTTVLAKSASGNVLVLVPTGIHYHVDAKSQAGERTGKVTDYPDATSTITASSDSGNVDVSYS